MSLTSKVIDRHDQSQSRSERNNATDRWCPGAFAMLDLHPAVDVVPAEVQLDHIQVSNDHWGLRGSFLIVVEPLAAQSLCLIPHLQQVLVVLHDHLEMTRNVLIIRE